MPTIVSVEDTSRLISKRMRVRTHATEQEFVIWGIPKLIASIREARAALDPKELDLIALNVQLAPDLLGNGLDRGSGEIALAGLELSVGLATNPFDVVNILNLGEFVRTVREADERSETNEPGPAT